MKNTTRTFSAGIIAVSLTFVGATVANATETCTASPAWSEQVIITPAVPAIPAVVEESHTVNHEAVDAVTRNDYQRYSWVKAKNDHQTPAELDATPTTSPERWQANTTNYEGAGHGTDPVGVAFQSNGNGHGNWFFWTVEVVTVVEGSPAWVETVIDVVGSPATPGVDAVTGTIEHVAVECPPVEVPVDETPVVEVPTDIQLPTTSLPVASKSPIPVAAELAYTGSTSPIIPIGFASLLLAAGAYLIRRQARA